MSFMIPLWFAGVEARGVQSSLRCAGLRRRVVLDGATQLQPPGCGCGV
ncbi:hypothetical protein ACWD5R_26860 [Streptomyces sp. NPDC002514]